MSERGNELVLDVGAGRTLVLDPSRVDDYLILDPFGTPDTGGERVEWDLNVNRHVTGTLER